MALRNVVLLGECMLELQGQAFGPMQQAYGGDTFNTAVYLQRCAPAGLLRVRYATALGQDALSEGLLQRWAQQGLDLGLVRRLPDRLPGLYLIETDERGERSFHFWRDNSAARQYFEAQITPLEAQADSIDTLYLSGISLAILPPAGRERVFALMQALRTRGAGVVFDNNYRPRLWSDVQTARHCFSRALALASLALVTADDHQALFGLPDLQAAVLAAQDLTPPELVIKRGAAPTLVRDATGPDWQAVPTETVARVVDTTAAGDSFAAGYLSRRLAGADVCQAAAFGNRLAARVIQHHGAIIERAAMQDLMAAAATGG